MIALPKVLPAPDKIPENLNKSAKWLAGEGAGSWFLITKTVIEKHYEISRFSPKGNIECIGIFESNQCIDLDKDFSLTYPSHCAHVTVLQYGKTIILKYKS